MAERAQRDLAGKQLCCDRVAVCYGDVLAALSRGERLADVEAEWRDAGLLGVQAGLFGEVV